MNNTYICFVICVIVLYFFVCYPTAREDESRNKDNVSIPKWLRKIVFPFLREKKISLLAVMGGIYLEVSFLGISMVYFLTKNQIRWNWEYVNGVWVCMFFILLPIIPLGMTGISEFRNTFTIGEKVGAIFLLLVAAALSVLGIVFIVGVMIDLGLF